MPGGGRPAGFTMRGGEFNSLTLGRGRSLAAKISVFAAVLVLWVSGTLVVFSAARQSRDFAKARQDRAMELGRLVAMLVRPSLEQGNTTDLARLVEAASETSAGFRVCVTAPNGSRLAGTGAPDGWRSVSIPVAAAGAPSRATVTIGWTDPPLGLGLTNGVIPLLIAGLIVLAVAIAVARLTLRSMIRPLETLEAAMGSVRLGKLHPVPVVRSGDEIERLGNSFNEMLRELERFREQVAENQELLEERIRQRTQTLADALVRAESANRAKAEFLANVSHELRTPLNGILGMLGLTLGSELSALQRDNLETARDCAESLLQLIVDILDLSRIEAGHLELSRKPFDIRKTLENGLEPVREQARRKQLDFELTVEPAVPALLKGDPERLCQVVHSLAANAVKFTDKGRAEVWVGVEQFGTGQVKLWIEVSDTGSGIAEQELPLIFDAFRQADGSHSRRHGGLGLGLAVAQRLLHLQGGRIMVESEVGRGSKFRLWLLLDRVAELSVLPAGSRHGPPPGPGGPRRVLVADDSPVTRKIVTSLLERGGYECDAAENGAEALDHVAAIPFDLVLLDLQMPILDGFQTARVIRSDPRFRAIPLLAMCSHDDGQQRSRCLESGFDDSIPKPVRAEQLLGAVRGLLGPAAQSRDPSAGSASSVPPPLNEAAALELLDHDARLLAGVVQLFLQVAPDRLRRLSSAMENGRMQDLLSEAEKLRVAAEAIAAEPLAQMARQLEDRALRADLRDASGLLFLLADELERLRLYSEPARQGIRTVA